MIFWSVLTTLFWQVVPSFLAGSAASATLQDGDEEENENDEMKEEEDSCCSYHESDESEYGNPYQDLSSEEQYRSDQDQWSDQDL